MLLSIAIFASLFLSSASVLGFFWETSQSRVCEWGKWKGNDCINKGGRVFRMLQTRKKLRAENGVADCVGPSVREISCKEFEYVVSIFFQTIASASSFKGKGPQRRTRTRGWSRNTGFRLSKVSSVQRCAVPFVGADGGVRITGRCDKGRRRRRSVNGNLEFDTEQEKISRVKRSPVKPEEILTKKNRDILFLLDGSGSVNEDNFKKEMRMATTLVNKFCGNISVGKDQTQVGVMTFDKEQHVHLNFDKYLQKHLVVREMGKIKYQSSTSGDTCLVDALNFVRTDMFTPERGARVFEKDAERMVIFISDGCANCGNDSEIVQQLKDMRRKMEQREIAFLSFFIGKTDDCVKKMNMLSEGSHCHQAWRAMDWAEFDGMTDHIAKATCMSAWTKEQPCPEA